MSDQAAVAIAELQDVTLAMILLRRGATPEAAQALRTCCGIDLPPPGRVAAGGAGVVIWQGPDRFLVVREGNGEELVGAMAPVLRGLAHVVDTTSARVIFTVADAGAEAALARLLPLDLHPRAFPPGRAAATLAQHIDVLVWREAAGFRVCCGRSFAADLRRRLAELTGGAEG